MICFFQEVADERHLLGITQDVLGNFSALSDEMQNSFCTMASWQIKRGFIWKSYCLGLLGTRIELGVSFPEDKMQSEHLRK